MNARTEQAIKQESNSLLSVQQEGHALPADATADVMTTPRSTTAVAVP